MLSVKTVIVYCPFCLFFDKLISLKTQVKEESIYKLNCLNLYRKTLHLMIIIFCFMAGGNQLKVHYCHLLRQNKKGEKQKLFNRHYIIYKILWYVYV